MANTSDIKNGMCIEHNGKLMQIIEFLHVKPGKGAAFVRTKLKNLENGRVIDHTFNAGVKINPVRIERRKYQYLYSDGEQYHFMNTETYEQIAVMEALVDGHRFLKESEHCEMLVRAENEEILSCEAPQFVTLQVTYTEPGIKGDTATNATKPAKVETEAEVRVPLFINEGDLIRIDTRKGEYCERVKA